MDESKRRLVSDLGVTAESIEDDANLIKPFGTNTVLSDCKVDLSQTPILTEIQ